MGNMRPHVADHEESRQLQKKLELLTRHMSKIGYGRTKEVSASCEAYP